MLLARAPVPSGPNNAAYGSSESTNPPESPPPCIEWQFEPLVPQLTSNILLRILSNVGSSPAGHTANDAAQLSPSHAAAASQLCDVLQPASVPLSAPPSEQAATLVAIANAIATSAPVLVWSKANQPASGSLAGAAVMSILAEITLPDASFTGLWSSLCSSSVIT